MDFVRNLGGEIMEGQRRDETNYHLRDSTRHDQEIQMARLRQFGQPVHSPGHRDKPPGVTKALENAWMDPQLQRLRGPKHTSMEAENSFSSTFQVNALHMSGYLCMHLQLNANNCIRPITRPKVA